MGTGYILKHGDENVALIDTIGSAITHLKILRPEYMPFLGNADIRKMQFWLRNRSVSLKREDIAQLLRENGCDTPEEFLLKNLALSLTDWYWLCPVNVDLSWEDVNLFAHGSGKIGLGTDTDTEDMISPGYNSNASLGGQMKKYWDYSEDVPMLVKKSSAYLGQQCINEEFSTLMHNKQEVPENWYVSYKASAFDGIEAECRCGSFVSYGMEFVSAYEVNSSLKKPNAVSEYEHFINICMDHGLEQVRKQMEYMLLSDFAITNEDRHFNNFGILRDAVSLRFISLAPVFDSGNSMFFRTGKKKPLTRSEILGMKITSFHDREEKVIRHIEDRGCLKAGSLPAPEDVFKFYTKKQIPRNRAELIAENYKVKLGLLEDFQNGLSVSEYREKHS